MACGGAKNEGRIAPVTIGHTAKKKKIEAEERRGEGERREKMIKNWRRRTKRKDSIVRGSAVI